MDQLERPKRVIRAALLEGARLTTAQGNRLARTVDFRKIISRLRREGFPVGDQWVSDGGRRWKVYYID